MLAQVMCKKWVCMCKDVSFTGGVYLRVSEKALSSDWQPPALFAGICPTHLVKCKWSSTVQEGLRFGEPRTGNVEIAM